MTRDSGSDARQWAVLTSLVLLCLMPDRVEAGDPIFEYSSFIGEEQAVAIHAVAAGLDGSTFVAGEALPSAPTTPGAYQTTSPSPELSGWVARYRPDGELVFATFLGGSGIDRVRGLALDELGRLHVVGETRSDDFPTRSAFQPSPGGVGPDLADAFVATLERDGSALLFSSYLGGADHDIAWDIGLDSAGNRHVVGQTSSTDFRTLNPVQAESGGAIDGFLSVVSAAGPLLRSTYHGGADDDEAWSVAVTTTGDSLLVGRTKSADFPRINDTVFTGDIDTSLGSGFITRFLTTPVMPYSLVLPSAWAADIALDLADNAHVVGTTCFAEFPVVPEDDAIQTELRPESSAFALKLNPLGTELVYSTFLGGGGGLDYHDEAMAVAIDSDGAAVVVGQTRTDSFPLSIPFQTDYAGGDGDGFVAVLSPDGRSLEFSTYLGGSVEPPWISTSDAIQPHDQARSVALGPGGVIHLGGTTGSEDFPITIDAITPAIERRPGSGDEEATTGFLSRILRHGSDIVFEPSAVDLGSAVPIDIRSIGTGLIVGWEETMGNPDYGLYLGDLTELFYDQRYNHQAMGFTFCALETNSAEISMPAGDVYFLAVAQIDGVESSYGRDSYGNERPVGTPACP
ncbi:MAG: hypothetical protein AAF533_28325 [Acidobacteriota bacterium]